MQDDDDDDDDDDDVDHAATFHRIHRQTVPYAWREWCSTNIADLQNFIRFFQTTIIWNLEAPPWIFQGVLNGC